MFNSHILRLALLAVTECSKLDLPCWQIGTTPFVPNVLLSFLSTFCNMSEHLSPQNPVQCLAQCTRLERTVRIKKTFSKMYELNLHVLVLS